ncbi:hypothetical protein JEQ12_020588 [Ovis aries]|uniref:Uncharacterized protein n=1 Tax=Ovis aries TaxID=9940 RepID=A0A835ZLS0_SHEEP|nr:hypothetical protein JEQ12_020588 [Ovis aries]
MEGVEEATALLASLEVSSALPGEQGWPQAAVEEECGRKPLEEEEMEEDVEEMEEDEEEGEIDFGLEDVEEEEHLPREYEEEEDENEQEGAAAVAGLEFPVERFGPLFWSHVDSFLRNFRNNKHVLFRPHADRLMAGGHSQAPSDPGEGPVPPQEREDLGEGGQVLQEEHDWMPGGPDRAGGGAGRDPSLLGVQASASEGMEGVEEATALLASLEVSSARPGEQGLPQAAVEEECGREPLEEEEMEEDVEEMEEDEEEGEIDFEVEVVEEEAPLSGEGEEEEDENEQEGAAAVTGLGFSMETFGPLFWSQVDSILRNFHYNAHVLFRPPTDGLMAGGCSPPPSDPGEGPVPPQEREDLGEGDRGLQGLDSAADFKLGYFSCQLLTPMSASFCPNDEGEDQYEKADEEEEDENEKPEEL